MQNCQSFPKKKTTLFECKFTSQLAIKPSALCKTVLAFRKNTKIIFSENTTLRNVCNGYHCLFKQIWWIHNFRNSRQGRDLPSFSFCTSIVFYWNSASKRLR